MKQLSTKDRFMKYVQFLDIEGGCWEWMGYKFPNGYGCFNRHSYAHRTSFELFIGTIPDKMFVCHSCDNRSCVNPKHLFLGTRQDNMNDMKNKNRQARGEKQWSHKLTEMCVYQIREMLERGYKTKEIAQLFGITQSNVLYIKSRKTWSWVKQEMYQNEQE